MYTLSQQQIDLILSDIKKRSIRLESLQYELLDHICIMLEQRMEKDSDFEELYRAAVQSFYRVELYEIEEETFFMMACRNRIAFSRTQFFAVVFFLFIAPFPGYDLVWLLKSGDWSIPLAIWGPTVVFSLFPLLVYLVLLLTPERLDPLIPANCRVLVGGRPFVKVIRKKITPIFN